LKQFVTNLFRCCLTIVSRNYPFCCRSVTASPGHPDRRRATASSDHPSRRSVTSLQDHPHRRRPAVRPWDPSNYLNSALIEAKKRRGFCAPNPSVGAVVVKNDEILARGKHWQAGMAHAEVDALNQLTQDQSRGATLYVTLEPCCHHGKTPPCTNLIIEREMAEVYYGYADPNPLVSGKGRAQLEAAGIHCEHLPTPEIMEFYRSYHYWRDHKRPWVTAKIALSADGKIAAADGSPVAITGPECQQFTHQNRYASDAILSTATTILADNPLLNVRLESTFSKPLYILDGHLRLTGEENIFSTAASLTIFHAKGQKPKYEKKGVTFVPIERPHAPIEQSRHPERSRGISSRTHRAFSKSSLGGTQDDSDKLCLPAILDYIGNEGVQDLWVEAGGKMFYELFSQKLLNRALVYLSPKVLGPEAKLAFPASFDVKNMGSKCNTMFFGADKVLEFIF
jgi:diaminohydroxyphosphoribosylaminopyrimidine deaminase/5-amino-6-(5-phosphoribosylamino)uracil reductase